MPSHSALVTYVAGSRSHLLPLPTRVACVSGQRRARIVSFAILFTAACGSSSTTTTTTTVVTVGDAGPVYESGTKDHACRDDGSCEPTLDCFLGICRVSCAADATACAANESCTFGYCLPTAEFKCGDGVIVQGEACDDGNAADGDGCSASCQCEAGWHCTGTDVQADCGDGLVVAGEGCDDGNTADGDGCAADCRCETGWDCSDATPTQRCQGGWEWDPSTQACRCHEGNTGTDCQSCIAGYQDNDDDGRCEPTCDVAIEQNLAGCTSYVACEDVTGVPVCRGCVVYVAQGATGDGRNWSHAAGSVQTAIATAAAELTAADADTCEVWVAEGTYYAAELGHSTIALAPNVAVLGGFVAGSYARELRDPNAYVTIFDGGDSATPTTFAAHVVTGASEATLDGVTVQHGNAQVAADDDGNGGGILIAGVDAGAKLHCHRQPS